MSSVRGGSAAERAAARRLVRGQRRLAFFTAKIRDAVDGRERLQQACAYVKAVGAELDERGKTALARAVAEVADRRNPR